MSSEQFYHGTKANLEQGALIKPGFHSNYGKRKKAAYVYLKVLEGRHFFARDINPSPQIINRRSRYGEV
jgi:hypothetical protein